MENKISVKDILRKMKNDDFVLNCLMPMSYTYGLPILQIRNERLCLAIPYLRYKVTGEADKTLVYPIRYEVTVALPEKKPVEFIDLQYDNRFAKIDFSAPIGLFRHEAIKHLNKKEYEAAREELFACYDKVIDALLNGSEYTDEDEMRMCELMKMLVEPCLLPIYKALDEDFYNKYLA